MDTYALGIAHTPISYSQQLELYQIYNLKRLIAKFVMLCIVYLFVFYKRHLE